MKFSVMFWNVENFGRNLLGDDADPELHAQRVDQVANHIKGLDPDLLGLCEIKDRVALRSLLMDKLADYDFGITDGAEGIELLAGWKRAKFSQVLFTQRREFKSDNPMLRPGSMVSAKFNDEFYNFLFLHTDSGTKSKDYNNRQDMFEKIWSLKGLLESLGDSDTKFICGGDLNTMGRNKSGSLPKISGDMEIQQLSDDALANGMKLLDKTYANSWRKGPSKPNWESNLDHFIATDNLNFVNFKNQNDANKSPVQVVGWNELTGNEKDDFTDNISDHCAIYLEIE